MKFSVLKSFLRSFRCAVECCCCSIELSRWLNRFVCDSVTRSRFCNLFAVTRDVFQLLKRFTAIDFSSFVDFDSNECFRIIEHRSQISLIRPLVYLFLSTLESFARSLPNRCCCCFLSIFHANFSNLFVNCRTNCFSLTLNPRPKIEIDWVGAIQLFLLFVHVWNWRSVKLIHFMNEQKPKSKIALRIATNAIMPILCGRNCACVPI